mmetsp:Transcript_57634/g.103527  ORF Transcript_57634/g.103527 Transcript_57634/m.103527 type:complete len:83 (+) Transcript_57634:125-373(+)
MVGVVITTALMAAAGKAPAGAWTVRKPATAGTKVLAAQNVHATSTAAVRAIERGAAIVSAEVASSEMSEPELELEERWRSRA